MRAQHPWLNLHRRADSNGVWNVARVPSAANTYDVPGRSWNRGNLGRPVLRGTRIHGPRKPAGDGAPQGSFDAYLYTVIDNVESIWHWYRI